MDGVIISVICEDPAVTLNRVRHLPGLSLERIMEMTSVMGLGAAVSSFEPEACVARSTLASWDPGGEGCRTLSQGEVSGRTSTVTPGGVTCPRVQVCFPRCSEADWQH